MKSFDKLATFFGLFSLLVCLLSVAIMRGTSSQMASHLARKHQEDIFWLETDKSSLWYSVNFAESSSTIRGQFIQMFEDTETKQFIKV